jgi:hypothetical protein
MAKTSDLSMTSFLILDSDVSLSISKISSGDRKLNLFPIDRNDNYFAESKNSLKTSVKLG